MKWAEAEQKQKQKMSVQTNKKKPSICLSKNLNCKKKIIHSRSFIFCVVFGKSHFYAPIECGIKSELRHQRH